MVNPNICVALRIQQMPHAHQPELPLERAFCGDYLVRGCILKGL